ncbi:hypothetical protein PHJA_001379100 [Phtheirospermum japonicum]|uniref:F-box associated beta-propeller type 1 domain-containing protein n=1 Tax=Phtheirospermum japonicum TaxID=374723 RepID=A0A830BY08_9LAMI|nr:hypothetical protein PHJA_001379100 [Phtheirospermum japonicum]
MKLSKEFTPLEECGIDEMVSLGFGYDAVGADFKVVRIVGEKSIINGNGLNVTFGEMDSANSDSWIAIHVGFQFSGFRAKNDLIVNGNPYWVARVDGNEVLVCFDVMELVFKIVPMPTLYWNALVDGCDEEAETGVETWEEAETGVETWEEADTGAGLVDWNGSLGAILYTINYEVFQKLGDQGLQQTTENERVEYVCVLVFDDVKRIWRTIFTFARIELDLDSFLLCTKNGKFLGKCSSGELFLFHLETGRVEVLLDAPPLMSEVYGYLESLAYIKGMEKVAVKNERQDLDD